MNFNKGDHVLVINEELETYNITGVVTKTSGKDLVHVKLDEHFVVCRDGISRTTITYKSQNLENLTEKVNRQMEEIQNITDERTIAVIMWNTIDSMYSAKVAAIMNCKNTEAAKLKAAKFIQEQDDPNIYYWVSITKPSRVELVYSEPTIRKVEE